ncbi:MAG: aldehyde dehydrogenase [Fusobacteriaceae bacterium]
MISKIQRQYFEKSLTKNLDFRIEQLQKIKQIINNSEILITDALNKDLGKCEIESFMSEIDFVINEIDFMIRNLKKLAKRKKVKTPLMFLGGSSFIIPEPYGTVLIIGPWNYPFQLVMLPLIGAIASGNCTVIKTSELAPNISKVVASLINNNFDKEYLVAVEGGVQTSQELLAQKFDYIFYTGGTAVGKIVMESASKNLTPVTLELGGKSPCIIDSDANLINATRRIIWGKFLNCGQTCVAPDYVFVHKKIKKLFIDTAIKVIKEFYGANPIENNQYSRIINEKHFNRLLSLMSDNNILYGGENDISKLKINPTLLDCVSEESEIMKEEIFGPLLPILEFEDLKEVISFINKRPNPLALYYFSNNQKNIDLILNEISSGGVCINDTINHIININLPFGGVGFSGMGSYHGKASFDTFSHKKSVLKNQIRYDSKLKYPPYSGKININTMRKFVKFFLR